MSYIWDYIGAILELYWGLCLSYIGVILGSFKIYIGPRYT